MVAPRLSHRLILETPTRDPDGAGGYVERWSVMGVLWAQITARSGRERPASGAAISVQSYQIVVRGTPVGHPERPTPNQRFRDGTRIFSILAVAESDPDGRYLTCSANEEVAT